MNFSSFNPLEMYNISFLESTTFIVTITCFKNWKRPLILIVMEVIEKESLLQILLGLALLINRRDADSSLVIISLKYFHPLLYKDDLV